MQSARERLTEYLESKNMPLTHDMNAVLDKVFDMHCHFSLPDLRDKLKIDISDDELRQILVMFLRAGLIRCFYFGTAGEILYEHIFGHLHHDHLICTECGKVIEFFDETIESRQNIVAKRHNFKVLRHSHQIFGLCHDCQTKGVVPEFDDIEEKTEQRAHEVPLTMVAGGKRAIIVALKAGHRLKQRLAAMGLNIGESIDIVSNSFDSPLIIRYKGTRLALGHGMAHAIVVRVVENQ